MCVSLCTCERVFTAPAAYSLCQQRAKSCTQSFLAAPGDKCGTSSFRGQIRSLSSPRVTPVPELIPQRKQQALLPKLCICCHICAVHFCPDWLSFFAVGQRCSSAFGLTRLSNFLTSSLCFVIVCTFPPDQKSWQIMGVFFRVCIF